MIPAKRTWVRAVLCVCAIAQCWSPFLPEAHSESSSLTTVMMTLLGVGMMFLVSRLM